MKLRHVLALSAIVLVLASVEITPAGDGPELADLIVHNGKILTVDEKSSIVKAVAVKGERILAVGSDAAILKHRGPATRVIDAKGLTVMPGLYDSHTHPLGAALSELDEELPYLQTLEDVFAYIRKKAEKLPNEEWIVLRFAFPTRLKGARFPTRAELHRAAPKHPALYNAGPASMGNSMALNVSPIT